MNLETAKAMMETATRFTFGVGAAYAGASTLTMIVDSSIDVVSHLLTKTETPKDSQPSTNKQFIIAKLNNLVTWGCCALVIGAVAERMGSFAMINYFLSAVSPLALGST